MHSYFGHEISYAQANLVKPFHERPQGFPFSLFYVEDGHGRCMMWSSHCILSSELGQQDLKAAHQVGREKCEPSECPFLERGEENFAPHYLFIV